MREPSLDRATSGFMVVLVVVIVMVIVPSVTRILDLDFGWSAGESVSRLSYVCP